MPKVNSPFPRLKLTVTGVFGECYHGYKIGDEVILIGEDGGHTLQAEDIASWAQTIPYEVLTGISQRVKRISFPF